MNKIKELLKGSPIAIVIAGLLIAGVASAAVLLTYGHTTGSATNVQQSVVFGDNSTEQTYEVGNSDPVAGNVYYNLVVLKNNSSDKVAPVSLSAQYWYGRHHGFTSDPEEGINTSYQQWITPVTLQGISSGVRPTVVYNPYDGTGWNNYKEYEMWYKTDEHATQIHYAYYKNSDGRWEGGTDTNVGGGFDTPFVTKEDGKYYMVNYGSGDSKHFDIYTSDNGINWTDEGTILSYTGSDLEKIDNPKILKDEDGYKMYFQGKLSASPNKYYIYLATSNAKSLKEIVDKHETFSWHNGPVLTPGADGSWDSFRVMQPMVFKPGNKGYLMLYTGYDQYDQKGKIGYATSNDGISWTKVPVSKEGYDRTFGTDAWKASLVQTNDNLVLFYQNGSKIDWTWLTSAVDGSNQMTVQAQEIKPFFIKNDFAINLAPGDYQIKTIISPVIGE